MELRKTVRMISKYNELTLNGGYHGTIKNTGFMLDGGYYEHRDSENDQ